MVTRIARFIASVGGRSARAQPADIALRPERLARLQRGQISDGISPAICETHAELAFPPPVVLARKQRYPGGDWAQATSWLGGLPQLGDIPWPSDDAGVPLHCAAQIDLTELTRACPESPLPSDGALAFFIGTGHAVVHIPQVAAIDTPLPPESLPARKVGGQPFPTDGKSRLNRKGFRKWPIDLITLPLPPRLRDYRNGERVQSIKEAMCQLLNERVPGRDQAFEANGADGEPQPLWWHSVRILHAQMVDALADVPRRIAGLDDQLGRVAQIEAQLPIAKALAEQVAALHRNKPALELLTPPQCEELAALVYKARSQADQIMQDSRIAFDTGDLSTASVRELFTGGEGSFTAIPHQLRDRINAVGRLTTQHQHQMFGLGGVQPETQLDQVLLLQLGSDDLMDWEFSDGGIYQFWISQGDLAEQRWDQVQLTFTSCIGHS